jgi:hypothetical protein
MHMRNADAVARASRYCLEEFEPQKQQNACARATQTLGSGTKQQSYAFSSTTAFTLRTLSLPAQEVHVQLRGLRDNVRMLALVAPLARAASSESLTALYARTFERAAFGFAKVD